MIGYIGRRLLSLVVVVWTATVLTFALGAAAPGDPALMRLERTLDRSPTAEQLARTRADMSLDRPLVVQYTRWLGKALHGDLGSSWQDGKAVTSSIRERFPRTLLLAACALLISIVLAVPLGVACAYKRNSFTDHACRVGALAAGSVPGYFLAYILLFVLAVRLRLLPVLGSSSPSTVVLPALTLGLGSAAGLTRFTRSAVLDVLEEDYMTAAKGRGVGTLRLLFGHALRNAAMPIVTILGLSLAGLLGGAFIVEWIFAWPGLGSLAVEAVRQKDYPVIQGFVLLTATAYVVVNFLTDLAYVSLDPRVRLSAGSGPAGRSR